MKHLVPQTVFRAVGAKLVFYRVPVQADKKHIFIGYFTPEELFLSMLECNFSFS